MLKIRCSKCKRKIFKYLKIGDGKVLRCYKSRIKKDFSNHNNKRIECQCGNLIGIDMGTCIKMKQNSFFTTGTVQKK